MTPSRLIMILMAALLANSPTAIAEEFFDNQFAVDIPDILVRMTDEQIKVKYPFGNAPPVAFTDETSRVSLALQRTRHPEKQVTVSRFKDMMRSMLSKVRPVKEWVIDDIVAVNNQEVARLSLITPVMESDDYDVINYMFFVVGKEDVFMVNMNCTTDKAATCNNVVDGIQNSIRLLTP